MKNSKVIFLVVGLLATGTSASAEGVARQTVDVTGQGSMGPVVSADGATLIRTSNGVSVSFSMPTPVSGSYIYPDPNPFQSIVIPGHPEVFSGWIFIFNNPAGCSDPCNGDDLGDTPARGGAYNLAGHVVGSGSTLMLAGHVSAGSEAFAGVPLDNPAGAEVHVAAAPHGMLLPDHMPTQINYPIGTPALWWAAIFLP